MTETPAVDFVVCRLTIACMLVAVYVLLTLRIICMVASAFMMANSRTWRLKYAEPAAEQHAASHAYQCWGPWTAC